MIYGYVGMLGHGKTLGMTAQLYIFHTQENRKIYTNYKTTFSELINPLDLLEFNLENAAVGIDEIYTLIDSRTNTQAQRLTSYFSFQMRKRGLDLCWTAQLGGSVDKRIRELTDRKIICVKDEEKFMYIAFDNYDQFQGQYMIPIDEAPKIWVMYDTKEVVMPMELDTKTSLEEIRELIPKCPTKKAFISALRMENPWVSLDICSSIWDFAKCDQWDFIERMLKR